MNFEIPTPSGQFILTINCSDIFIFIGSNGTGKTRLGLFLENQFFRDNTNNINKTKRQINKNKRELDRKNYYLDSDIEELSRIESMNEEEILSKAEKYRSDIAIKMQDGRTISNLELTKMAVADELTNVSFENLEPRVDSYKNKFLRDFSGQIIIADRYVIEVDLLNAIESDQLSIEKAKGYLIDKQKLHINKRKRYFELLENDTRKLEENRLFRI